MVFQRRGTVRGGQRRQTNWLSTGVIIPAALAAGASVYYTLWDQNAGGGAEPSVYVNPTLTRLRGDVIADWDLTSTAGPRSYYLFLAIVLVQSLTEPFVPSSDNILWTKLVGGQYNVRAGGTDVAYSIINLDMLNIEVDVKAQRKMGDLGKLMLYAANSSSSSGSVIVPYHFRALFKE